MNLWCYFVVLQLFDGLVVGKLFMNYREYCCSLHEFVVLLYFFLHLYDCFVCRVDL